LIKSKHNLTNRYLIAGWFVFSLLIFLFNFEQDRSRVRNEFDNEINQFHRELESRLQSNVAILDSFVSHAVSQKQVDSKILKVMAADVLKQYPHIYMIEIAEKVFSDDIEMFQKQKRDQGYEGFLVKSFSYDADRKWTGVDVSSKVHYPLVMLEPIMSDNKNLYGLDTFSIPALKPAMEKSRVNNVVASSLPFKLVEGDLAYVLFKPVFLDQNAVGYPDYYVLLVVSIDALIPKDLIDSEYKLYHSDFSQGNPDGMFYQTKSGSNTDNSFLPVFRRISKTNSGDQRFTLDVKRPMRWQDLWLPEFMVVFIVSVVALIFTLFFIRSRKQMEMLRREREQALDSLAKLNISGGIDEFYKVCVKNISTAYHSKFAFIGLFADSTKKSIQTRAVWAGDRYFDNFEYELRGTPCADILNLTKEIIPKNVVALYPDDVMLKEMNAESYYGSPLLNKKGEIVGLISVLDTKPMRINEWNVPLLSIFSERIGAEIERDCAVDELKKINDTLEVLVDERTKEYRQAKVEAEAANKSKSEFLSHMSHEFRTPMNAVLGFAQLLEMDHGLSEKQSDSVGEIVKAGNLMLLMIDEILDLSAIEAGKMSLDLRSLDMREIISQALSMLRPVSVKKDVTLECVLENKAEIRVFCDQQRLLQVLLNIFSNAIKYNNAGGKVWLTCSQDDAFFCLNVHDNGIGISEEKIQIIFDPFVRAGAEFTNTSGTGIGLSISRKLMQLMGGDISVKCEPATETCFTIKMPLSK